MKLRLPLVLACAITAICVGAPSAMAVPAGTGVRGTVELSWGDISGSPITTWSGQASLGFDPSSAGRQDALAAISTPSIGEAYRSVFAPQLQSVHVMSLSGTQTSDVICTGQHDDGSFYDYSATYTQSVGSVADGRMAFEILPPHVDLLTGRGSINLTPSMQSSSDSWYVQDHVILPGRWNAAPSTYPCPGDGAPANALPRILSPNGSGAIPVSFTDWLNGPQSANWPLLRTSSGWKVLIGLSKRQTFSESRFGPQDSQALDMHVSSNLYLSGNLVQMGASCKVPNRLIGRARTSSSAVKLAKRAGLTNTRYGGTRKVPYLRRAKFQITGRALDSQGQAPCGRRGAYVIYHYVPR